MGDSRSGARLRALGGGQQREDARASRARRSPSQRSVTLPQHASKRASADGKPSLSSLSQLSAVSPSLSPPSHSATVASSPTPRASLASLIGIRKSDTAAEAHRQQRDTARLHVATGPALAIILVLVGLLGICVALLTRQAVNIAAMTSSPPSVSEAAEGDTATGDSAARSTESESSEHTQTSDTQSEQGSSDTSTSSPAGTLPSGVIDLNSATAEELQTVNGIGPVMAERIVAYRTQVGRFTSVDQLLNVKGIGAKTLAKIRDAVGVA